MNRLAVRGRLLLGGDLAEGTVVLADGRIAAVERGDRAPVGVTSVLEAPLVAPGLIDL